jgi:hypothetical protein
MCGHPGPFRTVRDLERLARWLFMFVRVSARSFVPVAPSVAPESHASAQAVGWLPAGCVLGSIGPGGQVETRGPGRQPGEPLRSARGGYPADVATGLIAGLLGIFGTVVGGVLATWNARHTADRTAWRAREELRRQEFRSAIVQFAAALLVYRTAEMDRWHARHGGFRDEPSAAADVYRARTAVWNALYVLKLSTDDRELCQEARRAIEQAESIKYPDSQAEMDLRADQVQDDLDKVITMAQLAKPGRSQSLDVR